MSIIVRIPSVGPSRVVKGRDNSDDEQAQENYELVLKSADECIEHLKQTVKDLEESKRDHQPVVSVAVVYERVDTNDPDVSSIGLSTMNFGTFELVGALEAAKFTTLQLKIGG